MMRQYLFRQNRQSRTIKAENLGQAMMLADTNGWEAFTVWGYTIDIDRDDRIRWQVVDTNGKSRRIQTTGTEWL